MYWYILARHSSILVNSLAGLMAAGWAFRLTGERGARDWSLFRRLVLAIHRHVEGRDAMFI